MTVVLYINEATNNYAAAQNTTQTSNVKLALVWDIWVANVSFCIFTEAEI